MVGGGGVGEAGFDILQRGCEAGEIGFLRKIADRGAWLGETPAGIGLHQAGCDAKEGGFAGAVAADEADAITGRDRKSGTGQEPRGAECQGDVLKREKRRRHAGAL